MPNPTETPVKTDAPVRPDYSPDADPERYYSPERLCPSQRDDAEKYSRP